MTHTRPPAPALLSVLGALVAAAASACGGSKGVSGGDCGGGGGPLSAKIDGVPWSADPATIGADHSGPGAYSFAGTNQPAEYTLTVGLSNIAAPGTYPLGVGVQIFGGVGSINGAPGQSWTTPFNGTAGEVTVCTLTDTGIAGAFSFMAEGDSATSVGTKVIADGKFDLLFNLGGNDRATENMGSKVTGSFGGTPFNATGATVMLTGVQSGMLTVTATNNTRTVTITISDMTGPMTYALNAAGSVRTVQVSEGPASQAVTWSSQQTGGSGSVVVTTVSSARIKGTFTATLAGATGNMNVSGAFDMGRP